jgi:hypothetical protein
MRSMSQEPLVEDIQNYAQDIVDTVGKHLLMLDSTLRVRSANNAFYLTKIETLLQSKTGL